MDLEDSYAKRLPALRRTAQLLEEFIKERLAHKDDSRHVDDVKARAKSVQSFMGKAKRKKYTDPLDEIQDQVAVRIVVYYLEDVEVAKKYVTGFFGSIEDKKAGVTEADVFGYEAWHCILAIPDHILNEAKPPVEFFELQIATLFQHAWAQAAHDLAYKPAQELPFDFRRRTAWAAAQAYGADDAFDRLAKDLRN